MLSEQTLPSFLGYLAGMLFNPNNVTAEAAPITVQLELEVGRMVAAMLGFNPNRAWAHICSGGTVANLEALWVARTVQFVPFMVREFCQAQGLPFRIHTANGAAHLITTVGNRELMALRPNEAVFMWRKLAQYLHEEQGQPVAEVLDAINAHVAESRFNPAHQGLPAVLEQVGMRPLLLVSTAAHYSVKKAANLLGYGEQAVRAMPVTPRFQMDVSSLRQQAHRSARRHLYRRSHRHRRHHGGRCGGSHPHNPFPTRRIGGYGEPFLLAACGRSLGRLCADPLLRPRSASPAPGHAAGRRSATNMCAPSSWKRR